MDNPKMARRIFALALTILWGAYSLLNLAARLPNLQLGYRDGWDLPSKLEGVTSAANGGVLFQDAFQDANAQWEYLVNKRTSKEFLVVKADNGQYMYTSFYPYEIYDYATQALQLREVQRAAQAVGASFLYLNCPDLYTEGVGPYGDFPVSNLNPRSDAFLYFLDGYGVVSLDARQALAASALPATEYRYNTEPHWTTQASFEVYLSLVEQLKTQGVEIDPDGFYSDRGHFSFVEHKGAFVGALGKQAGVPYVTPDDFTLIEPNFETGFTLGYLADDPHTARQGDFSVLLDGRWMDEENPYRRNLYNTYLTGEYAWRSIQNTLNPSGPKILVIGDSYMLPLAAFLAAAAGEIELVWPYSLPGGENLAEYVRAGNFDAVVVGMSPSTLYGSGFNFLMGIEVPQVATP